MMRDFFRARPAAMACAALLSLGASTAFAQCINEEFTVGLPTNLDESKLKDGGYQVGAVLTNHGLFQGLAVAKGGKLGDITFYHGLHALTLVADDELPETGTCEAEKVSQKGMFEKALDWLVPAVEADSNYRCTGRGTVTIKLVECGRNWCSYRFYQGGKQCGSAVYATSS